MNRLRPSRLLGIGLLALATLSMGTRPSLNAQQAPAAASAAFVGGAFGDSNDAAAYCAPLPQIVYVPEKPMTLEATRIWLKLQERIPMEFPKDTPLADVVKYIQSKTVDPANLPDGIPIYLDPVGLQDSDKTPADTIMINLKGIPLATTLKLLLRQLSLDYHIQPDGFLYITSTADDEFQPNIEAQIRNDLNRMETAIFSLRREFHGLPAGQSGVGRSPASPATQPQRNLGGFR